MTRHGQRWNHRTSSGADRIYRGAPRGPAKPDTRTTATYGQQGWVTCHECGAQVTLKLAPAGLMRSDGIPKGEPVLSPHRVGGGRYSIRRNDALCRGTHTMPVPIEEESS